MKNILFLDQFSYLGGAQNCLVDIFKAIDRKKFQPYVAIPAEGDFSKKLKELDIPCFFLPLGDYSFGKKTFLDYLKYMLKTPLLIISLIYLIKKNRIDLIYLNGPRTYFFASIAAKLCRKKVVWHLHLIISNKIEKFLLYLTSRMKIDKLIVVSKAVANSLPFLSCEIVPNGIDIEKFSKIGLKSEFKEKMGFEDKEVLIGSVGQLIPRKGQMIFILAAQKVLSYFPQARFLIAGTGDRDYLSSLKKLCHEIGIEKKALFLGQINNVPEFLNALDLFVLPSIEPEAFPLSLLEAMSMERVVVAADFGGVVEIIDDQLNGFFFNCQDVASLADKICYALRNSGRIAKIGKTAREKIVNDFSLNLYQKRILKILGEVI